MSGFRIAFNERFEQAINLSEGAALSARKAADLDHPGFADLQWGQATRGDGAVMFLDIRGYTRLAMAFADQPEKTARIIDAVVGGAVEALTQYGAHINDYTGDGVMAVFGGEPGSLDAAHDQAIWAAADLMTDMSATLRQELLGVDIDDPVRVAIGLVSGPILWKRVGTAELNRIMALGEVAPLAAKYVSGKETKAWETMIGGEVIGAVPASLREKVPDYVHEYKGVKMSRERWLLDSSAVWNGADSAAGVGALRAAPISLGPVSTSPNRSGDGIRRQRTIG